MSDLPLQPVRQPWSPRLARLAVVLVLLVAALLLGWLVPRPVAVPHPVIGGPGQSLVYAREARRLIDTAQQRVWMAMYVVRPDDGPVGALLQALVAAAARGVDVRVCLDRGGMRDGEPDLKHCDAAAWLAERGVRVVLDEDGITTHAKVVVVDGRRVLSGSHNWTRSALTTNRELSWLVDDAQAATAVEQWLAAIPGWDAASIPER